MRNKANSNPVSLEYVPGLPLLFVLLVMSIVVGLSACSQRTVRVDDPIPRPTPEQRFFDWTRVQFSKALHEQRRMDLAKSLKKSGGGVFLAPSRHGVSAGESFRQLDDFLYFTGLELPDSVLAIDTENGKAALFVPERDERFESPSRLNDFPGRPLRADPALPLQSGITDIRSIDELPEAIQRWSLADRMLWIDAGKPGAIEQPQTGPTQAWNASQTLTHYLETECPTVSLQNAFEAIARLRMIKSPEEVEIIRRACAITVAALREAAGFVRNGVDERSLEARLEAAFKLQGAQRLAFDSIIKSGPNSLWPWRILAAHYDRRNRRMHDGELVIFDVGCELDHYASDMGRTFPVSGRFTPEQRRILKMVTEVSDVMIAAIRPGVTLAQVQEAGMQRIPLLERKYMQTGSYFGHHIGLDVGDASWFEAILEPGMIFTVEPWYYNHDKQIAVFIEDDVLVTSDGVENLTRSLPRSPEALERMVRRR